MLCCAVLWCRLHRSSIWSSSSSPPPPPSKISLGTEEDGAAKETSDALEVDEDSMLNGSAASNGEVEADRSSKEGIRGARRDVPGAAGRGGATPSSAWGCCFLLRYLLLGAAGPSAPPVLQKRRREFATRVGVSPPPPPCPVFTLFPAASPSSGLPSWPEASRRGSTCPGRW